ncbi:RhoGEF domain-containing protein [uncultured Legionella sp.]|uniref:RhoGEF domain-containing protein n=1 Tax=uncultured Legionella sp. TaxID=210934 RepID=UPI002636DC4F|nr:RhoGEF domain-containing protein [uncultured Legionella sp.]
MYNKTDEKIFDNKVFQEMLDTERSYNNALGLLGLALLMGTIVQGNPILLSIKEKLPMLQEISNGLLQNAEKTVDPELTESERNILKVQRTQLLTVFFKAYKDYAVVFDKYLAAEAEYAVQHKTSPKDNPFHKINLYLKQHGNNLGLGDHLIQPIQRGPRYSLLVAQAAKSLSSEDENTPELEALRTLISKELFDINSAMKSNAQTEGYWFGKITYTLLFGEPGKTPVQPTPVKVEEKAETKSYRFGDFSRGFFNRIKGQAETADTTPPTPAKKSSDELVDEFTLVDEEGHDSDNETGNDEDTSKKLGR